MAHRYKLYRDLHQQREALFHMSGLGKKGLSCFKCYNAENHESNTNITSQNVEFSRRALYVQSETLFMLLQSGIRNRDNTGRGVEVVQVSGLKRFTTCSFEFKSSDGMCF